MKKTEKTAKKRRKFQGAISDRREPTRFQVDEMTLDLALIGAELVADHFAHKRAEIQQLLGSSAPADSQTVAEFLKKPRRPDTAPPKKHTISEAGRARIAAAQRKRWAQSRQRGPAAAAAGKAKTAA
jgi:hypothetical protein